MRVFVYIATTQGLVAVQRITEEEPDVQSVVCLNGTVEALPISGRYHDFVKKGTGLIHKEFGHGAFRVDLDARVDQGASWQLAIYLAHHLHHQGRLAGGDPQPGDLVIWATGAVQSDRAVAEVAGVDAKFQRSAGQLRLWQQQGVSVLCMLPRANGQSLPRNFRRRWQLPADLIVCSLPKVSDAVGQLDRAMGVTPTPLPMPAVEPAPLQTDADHLVLPSDWPAGRWLGWLAGGLLLSALTALASVAWFSQQPTVFEAPPREAVATLPPASRQSPPVEVPDTVGAPALEARLAAAGGSCTDAGQPTPVPLQGDRFSALPLMQLCALQLRPPDPDTAVLVVALDSGAMPPLARDGLWWQIPRPAHGEVDRAYAIVLLPGDTGATADTLLRQRIALARQEDVALSAPLLRQWLGEQGWRGQIYQQILEAR